jgi:uncharacterized protein with ParB-like and HNH nuclease domain
MELKQIKGQPKNLRQLLSGIKYTVHYYQREYMWGRKQIEELIEDLTSEFLDQFDQGNERSEIINYGHYFMGSIVLTESNNEIAIIDGQQRLTSLSLLLIYLYHELLEDDDKSILRNLIYSSQFGKKSFNINVEERNACLNALYTKQPFNPIDQPESVRNLYARYQDIKEVFPDSIDQDALTFFVDWLIEKVDFIEITATTEQDAHKIFVTMNDRGLSLTPTEMLKGFLLSEIKDDFIRNKANNTWKDKVLKLKDIGKDEDSDFIKTWLRAKYAESIRETKKGAVNQDFDIIGTTFHKWFRENLNKIGLDRSSDFEDFILDKFVMYSDIYMRLKQYSTHFNKEFEYVYYNANNNFTLQNQVILASINSDDTPTDVNKKIKMVSCFIDQFIMNRVFNFKTVDYSSIKNAMFSLSKKVRNLDINQLSDLLLKEIMELKSQHSLNGVLTFYLNGFTKRYMLHILSRLTYFIEQKSQINSSFVDYVDRNQRNSYDIEHILANDYNLYSNEFKTEEEFQLYRNKFGALLLLPKDKNRSYQDKPYVDKLQLYFSENLLARSLNDKCYTNNPSFLKFKNDHNLSFIPYDQFGITQIEDRQKLNKELTELIWSEENIKKLAL